MPVPNTHSSLIGIKSDILMHREKPQATSELLSETVGEGRGRSQGNPPKPKRPSEDCDVHSMAELQLADVNAKAWHLACLV